MKLRLDHALTQRGLTPTRSQAESWVRLGRVRVAGKVITKPGFFVDDAAKIDLSAPEQYVSRAGLKLASVADVFGVDFQGKIVLDVGSSTGGFTDYALQHGAARVYAIDVGTDQLHPSLRGEARIELHEKTDIRNIRLESEAGGQQEIGAPQVVYIAAPDIIVCDVSFVSLRNILPHLSRLMTPRTVCLVMVKPQFEASRSQLTKGGIVKNDRVRRDIFHDFELWTKRNFLIRAKADSDIAGAHGNRERFYDLGLIAAL